MMPGSTKWYDDRRLVDALPLRYRAYALYSHLAGDSLSRRVAGGSFLLRLLKEASSLVGSSTVAPVRGIDDLIVVTDFADERVLDVIHEIRGENPEFAVLRGLLSEGDTFVDVGANFGTFSLLASRLVGSNGRVIAIEPQPRLAALIRQSLELSRVTNCSIEQVACGAQSGEATLLVPDDDSGRAGFFAGFSGAKAHKSVSVPVATLDSLLAAREATGNMVIKIDVEGSEIDVLDGASEIIRARQPAILVELNPWSARAAGRSSRDVVGKLEDLGYSTFATVESYPRTILLRDLPLDKQLNLVATA
jgi:FkbM family methyltransferase